MRLGKIEQPEEDLPDISLVLMRMLTSGAERHSLDHVLSRFGFTREDLRDVAGMPLRGDPLDEDGAGLPGEVPIVPDSSRREAG